MNRIKQQGWAFWLTLAAVAAMYVATFCPMCHGEGAFTAPGGQWIVDHQAQRLYPNPQYQRPAKRRETIDGVIYQYRADGSRFAVRSAGQCGPNGCPGGTCPLPTQPQYAKPRRPQNGGPDDWAQVQQAHPSTCRIRNQLNREAYLGSGTLVDKTDQFGLIVTCQHLFRGGTGTVTVTFPDGQSAVATVLTVDGPWDLSALLIRAPKAEPVTVASAAPRPGEPAFSAGYGPNGQYAVNSGRVVGYVRTQATTSNETLQISGSARDGDSGGPVFNARGELVAVLWGTDGRMVGGTYCGRVDKFLLTAGRYLLPWNAQINDPARDPRNQQPQVIVPPQQAAPPLPQSPSCPQVDLGPLESRVSALEGQMANVKAVGDRLSADFPEVKQAIAAVKGESDKTSGKLAEALNDESSTGLFGRVMAKVHDKFGGVLSEVPWIKWVGLVAAVGLLILFLRKEGAKAAVGEPTRFQQVAALTPNQVDDQIAARLAGVQAGIHEKIAGLHGTVANLAGSVASLVTKGNGTPPAGTGG